MYINDIMVTFPTAHQRSLRHTQEWNKTHILKGVGGWGGGLGQSTAVDLRSQIDESNQCWSGDSSADLISVFKV